MADHEGGGSTCFIHSFSISLRHALQSLGLSFLIISRRPGASWSDIPISSHLADTLLVSSFWRVVSRGGSGCAWASGVVRERWNVVMILSCSGCKRLGCAAVHTKKTVLTTVLYWATTNLHLCDRGFLEWTVAEGNSVACWECRNEEMTSLSKGSWVSGVKSPVHHNHYLDHTNLSLLAILSHNTFSRSWVLSFWCSWRQ